MIVSFGTEYRSSQGDPVQALATADGRPAIKDPWGLCAWEQGRGVSVIPEAQQHHVEHRWSP